MPWKYEGNGSWDEVMDNPSTNGRPERPPTGGGQTGGQTGGGGNTSTTPPPILTDTSNKDTTESTNNASGEYIEVEENILVGEMNVVPNPDYRAKATVLLQYLGKNLTGLYFVDKVVHSFSNDGGYTQTMSVSRNGFGDTIKSGSASKPVGNVAPTEGGLMNGSGDSSRPPTSTPPPTPPKVETRYYTIVSGDTLWGIATKFYGDGSKYPTIFNANKGVIKNANLIYPNQRIKIP